MRLETRLNIHHDHNKVPGLANFNDEETWKYTSKRAFTFLFPERGTGGVY